MAIQKQSRLDSEAINYRAEKKKKNEYELSINEYSGDHENAMAHDDENHPHGKGTGKAMQYIPRNLSAPKTQIEYGGLDTHDEKAGGSYDKYGTQGVEGAFQGNAGRNYLTGMNIYDKNHSYGVDSVDVDTTVSGQFTVKPR